MKTRLVIYADEGMVLTNGETYGKIIYLEEGVSASDFYEITEAEHEEIMKKQEEDAGWET